MPRFAAVFLVRGAIGCWLCMVISSASVEAIMWPGPPSTSRRLLSGDLYFIREGRNGVRICRLDGEVAGNIRLGTGTVYDPQFSDQDQAIHYIVSNATHFLCFDCTFSLRSFDLATGATETLIIFPQDFWPDRVIWLGKKDGAITSSGKGIHHWMPDGEEQRQIGRYNSSGLSRNDETGLVSWLWDGLPGDVFKYTPRAEYWRYDPLTLRAEKWSINFAGLASNHFYSYRLGEHLGTVYFREKVYPKWETAVFEFHSVILAWDFETKRIRRIRKLGRDTISAFSYPWALPRRPWPAYAGYRYLLNVETGRKASLPPEWVWDMDVDDAGNPVILGHEHVYVYDKETLEPKAQYEVVVPEPLASTKRSGQADWKSRNTERLWADLKAPALDTVDLEAPRSTEDRVDARAAGMDRRSLCPDSG